LTKFCEHGNEPKLFKLRHSDECEVVKKPSYIGCSFYVHPVVIFFFEMEKKNTTYFLKPKCPMAYFPSLSTIQLWFACTKVHRVSSNAVTTDFMVHDSYITIQNLQLA
jgi:hypothetical protein